MRLERFIVCFSIFIVVFAIGYAVSAVATKKPRTQAVIVPPKPIAEQSMHELNAPLEKLEKLEQRLVDAQKSIDSVMLELASATIDSQRDAARVRLEVLYRLEAGLTADIAELRGELQSSHVARVDRIWQLLDKQSR